MIEQAAVSFLRFEQHKVGILPFNGVMHRAHQPAGVQLAFHQIILGAGMHGFHGDGFIVLRTDGDNGHPGRDAPKHGDVGQSRAVR